MPILRMILGVSILISVLLTGCGQGLSGQAIGEDDENIEEAKDTEDIHALERELHGISDSLANLSRDFAKVEGTIDVINASVAELVSLVENVDQAEPSAVFDDAVGDRGVNSNEIVEALKSNIQNCDVPHASQLLMKGFIFQIAYPGDERETFLKVAGPVVPQPGDIIGALGEYERVGPFNDWHYGTISASGDNYLWTNRAGSSWVLYPDFDNSRFGTDTSNPYYNFPSDSPSRYFTILSDDPPCAD